MKAPPCSWRTGTNSIEDDRCHAGAVQRRAVLLAVAAGVVAPEAAGPQRVAEAAVAGPVHEEAVLTAPALAPLGRVVGVHEDEPAEAVRGRAGPRVREP